MFKKLLPFFFKKEEKQVTENLQILKCAENPEGYELEDLLLKVMREINAESALTAKSGAEMSKEIIENNNSMLLLIDDVRLKRIHMNKCVIQGIKECY